MAHAPVTPSPTPHTAARPACDAAQARGAQAEWGRTPVRERVACLRRARIALAHEAGPMARSTASCRGCPTLAEVLASEVAPLLAALRFLERKAPSILSPRKLGWPGRPWWLPSTWAEVHREPVGLVLVIGPGNYPLFLSGVQALQALAAGNAVWVKPAPGCSPPMHHLCDLLRAAGVPTPLFTVLPESVDAVHEALAQGVDKVVFTGAAAHGRDLLTRAADRLIPATVELSGSDPVLVRDDADLDLVVRALLFGLRLNGGRTCIAPRRVYARRAVLQQIEQRLVPALAPKPDLGRASTLLPRLLPLLTEALDRGARLVAGGIDEAGALSLPIVIADAPPDLGLLRQDLFIPLLVLVPVEHDAGAVERANDSPFALGASIFTRDRHTATRLAHATRAGVVTINDLIVPTADPRLPFGGRSGSGFGVTRGPEGLLDLTVPKVITRSRGRFRPAFDPPHPGDDSLWIAALRLAHGRGLTGRVEALGQMARALLGRRARAGRPPHPTP